MALSIPANFSRAIADHHDQAGREWLARLPALVATLANRWKFEFGQPFEDLAHSYVMPVTLTDGTAAVLKAAFPGRALDLEVAALRAFAGRGVVRLFDADTSGGAILIERLDPGTPLTKLGDEAAINNAISVMREIRATPPAPGVFPTTAEWAAGLAHLRVRFGGGTGPFPAALVDAAERVFEELHSSATRSVLLHGDLHHGNILAATRRSWLAIDPKGVIGEPAYEVGALLRNPMPDLLRMPHVIRVQARRLDQLSDELDLDRRHAAAYAFAQAVLASWWQFEDHGGGWEPWIRCAELLQELYEQQR